VRGDPRNALARFKLGIAYAELDALDRAIEQWQAVLTLEPQNQGARDNIQRAKAKLAAARPTPPPAPPAQAAATPKPTSAPATPPPATPAAPPTMDAATVERLARTDYEQAVGLISQRRYADSLVALNAAIQLQPGFAIAYVARGSAAVGLGRYSDAVRDYLKGLSLNGNQASPLFGLGEAYRGLGDRAHAAQYYQACTQSSAPDAASVRDLARKRYADLVK
jgi:tetratricopeptide (TPR) repeat protein